MPRTGSVVSITYWNTYPSDGVDITSYVMFESARFEMQANAMPGAFEFTCKDVNQDIPEMITGNIITVDIDGVRAFGGFLTQVSRVFAFPVVNTMTEDPVKSRLWRLRGVDFNVLFDKVILYNHANERSRLPDFNGGRKDGWLIRKMCAEYLDLHPALTYVAASAGGTVEDVVCPFSVTDDPMDTQCDASKKGSWVQAGSTWRKQMEDFAQFSGARWYIDPSFALNFHALENSESRWGFSDVPNHNPITSGTSFQGATIGFREMDTSEDGSFIVNDALVWGGSEWAGNGGTTFARKQSSSSIATHGRWQLAETHFGELGFGTTNGVKVRAAVIVAGQPGSVGGDIARGLRFSQWSVSLKWFAHDVPKLSGDADHLVPGKLVTISLATFGDGVDPLVLTLPLRSLRMSFPELDPSGNAYVSFDGLFSLQMDDAWTLWRYLLRSKSRIEQTISAVSTANNSSVNPPFGATYYDSPSPVPDGVQTSFSIPFSYIAGTLRVWVNGVAQSSSDFSETAPETGTFTFSTAPLSGDVLLVECRVGL